MKRNNEIIKYLFLAGIFIAGIILSLLVSDRIALPFENPWNIVGQLAQQKYNPGNDILKFITIVSLPSILLLASFFFFKGKILTQSTTAKEVNNDVTFVKSKTVMNLLLPVSIILVIIVSLNIQTYHGSGDVVDSFHEGETLGTAISYMADEIPYKEIIFVHGVFQDPLRSVIAFQLFGQSIGASRTLQSMIKVLSFILLFLMLLKLFRNDYLYTVIAFILLTGTVYLHFILIPPRDVTTFLFIILFLALNRLIQSEAPFSKVKFGFIQFLFSFLSLASFIYSIDRGFYLFGTFLLISPVMFFFFRKKGHTKQYVLSSVTGLILAFLLMGFLLKWDYASFFDFVFLKIPRYKELMDGIVYPFWTLKFLLPVAIIALNLFWIVYTFLNEYLKRKSFLLSMEVYLKSHLIEIFLLLLSVLFFRSALGRSDWSHVIYSSTMSYLLVIYIFTKYYLQPYFHKKKPLKKLTIIITITAGFLIIITGSYRIYNNGLFATNFPYHTEDSHFIPGNYKNTINFLNNNLDENENFFTMTSEAIWYYFINKPAPTAFSVVWFAMPEFYQERVINDLENSNVKIILYKNDFWTNAIDDLTSQERLPLIDNYIRNHYSFFKKIDDNELWIKNSKAQ